MIEIDTGREFTEFIGHTATTADFEFLDQKDKKGVIYYLEQYFELSEYPKSLIYSLQRTCI